MLTIATGKNKFTIVSEQRNGNPRIYEIPQKVNFYRKMRNQNNNFTDVTWIYYRHSSRSKRSWQHETFRRIYAVHTIRR